VDNSTANKGWRLGLRTAFILNNVEGQPKTYT